LKPVTDARATLCLLACVACGGNDATPPDAAAPADASADTAPADGPTQPRFVVIGTSGGLSPILVYDVAADGDLDPIREFRSANPATDSVTAVQIAGSELFVSNEDNLLVFDLASDGANQPDGVVAPKRSLHGPGSEISNNRGMFVFGAEIFSTTFGGKVLVHGIDATGETPPLRTFTGPRSYNWICVVGTEIFVSAGNTIDVFPLTASGTVTPIRSITGPATELESILGFHATSTELFVTDQTDNRVRVYPIDAEGNVAPLRTIKGLDPNARPPTVVGDELFVLHRGPQVEGSFTMGTYSVFSTSADEFATPLRHVKIGGSSLFTVVALDAN
jgi:hypothetical protein